MRVYRLLFAALTVFLVSPAWGVAQETPPESEPAADEPFEASGEDCMTAEVRAVPSAVIVIPSTDCSAEVDITDPNFSPFRIAPLPGGPAEQNWDSE